MNILVTGAWGQLGSWLRILASASSDRFVFTDVAQAGEEQLEMLRRLGGGNVPLGCSALDITDIDGIRQTAEAHGIDAIVNCAAFTNVDAAEDRPELAEALNAAAVGNLAAVARERNALLVHISTDYVFGADPYNTPCSEDRKGTPSGVYGLTKLHGEQAVIASGCKYVIMRTAWLYSEFGKNFLKTMLALTASKPEIRVVFDQAGTPTYAAGLAHAVLAVLDDYRSAGTTGVTYHKSGIYNFSDEGVCSWYDFAKAVAAFAGNDSCRILPCHSGEFPSKVVRPAYSVLDKTRIKETFGLELQWWPEGVRKCTASLAAHASRD